MADSISVDLDAVAGAVNSDVGAAIANKVFSASAGKAKGVFDSYTNVDSLRPYFDLEPRDVFRGLVRSLVPLFSDDEVIPADLYGPTMLSFTLSGVLLILMKNTQKQVVHIGIEGSLMGTAFGITFGYLFTITAVLYAIGFMFNSTIKLAELVSTTGYGLFAYCIVLLSAYVHAMDYGFFLTFTTVGTLSALRIAIIVRSRTSDKKQGSFLGGAAFLIHWLYLWYLHAHYCEHIH